MEWFQESRGQAYIAHGPHPFLCTDLFLMKSQAMSLLTASLCWSPAASWPDEAADVRCLSGMWKTCRQKALRLILLNKAYLLPLTHAFLCLARSSLPVPASANVIKVQNLKRVIVKCWKRLLIILAISGPHGLDNRKIAGHLPTHIQAAFRFTRPYPKAEKTHTWKGQLIDT